MANEQGRDVRDLEVDVDRLYREEVFTDLGAASVRRLTPVKKDGSDDAERPVLFLGDTQIMTQMGPLPLQFPLEAETLEQAFAGFPAAVQEAVEKLNDRAREAMRDEASRIVVPGGGMPGGGGAGGMGGGGMPGGGPGGKIFLDK